MERDDFYPSGLDASLALADAAIGAKLGYVVVHAKKEALRSARRTLLTSPYLYLLSQVQDNAGYLVCGTGVCFAQGDDIVRLLQKTAAIKRKDTTKAKVRWVAPKGGKMLTMNEDVAGALQAYMRLLDEARYYEAHEVLEEAWHPLRLRADPLANLVKGLINAAVAFEHLKRARPQAKERACRVMASFERHKGLCVEGIAHEALFVQACRQVERLKSRWDGVFG